MPLLTEEEFRARVETLRSVALSGPAGVGLTFYDAELLGWLDEVCTQQVWSPFMAFQRVAHQLLIGPLEIDSLRRYAAAATLPPEIVAAQMGHRFHGLMAAFSPASCFDDPGKDVKNVNELIRSSEADYLRCKPFAESIQRFVDRAEAITTRPIDMIDAGCGPHLFWSVLAASMSARVRVCAIERDTRLAQQAREFAVALGVDDRIQVIEADASSSDFVLAPRSLFKNDKQPFEPSLIVSETHCVLMFEEAGDQVLRNLHRQFPAAVLVPEGVEILGGYVDARRIDQACAPNEKYSFSRLMSIAATLKASTIQSLGKFMARDARGSMILDAQGRRRVGPWTASPPADEPGARTPVFGTRLLFPMDVSPLEPGHSLGITEWLWAVRGTGAQPGDAVDTCCLSSVFMAPDREVVYVDQDQQFSLEYCMGAKAKPIFLRISRRQQRSAPGTHVLGLA